MYLLRFKTRGLIVQTFFNKYINLTLLNLFKCVQLLYMIFICENLFDKCIDFTYFHFLYIETLPCIHNPKKNFKKPPSVKINLKLIYDVKEILNSQISHCEL